MSGPGLPFTLLSFFLVIGPLVFIHELGHYFVGRWFGVHADAFSIGFGREVIGWSDRRGTRWKIGWLPLGGYVKFKGDMNPASQASPDWLNLPPEERNRTFQSKPAWQRFLIVLAGPAVNFLFAILVYMAVFAQYGQPSTTPAVTAVAVGSAAEGAGLRAGDLIKSVNGNAIGSFEELAGYVAVRPETRMVLIVERGGRELALEALSSPVTVKDQFGNSTRIGRLGVTGAEQRSFRQLGLLELPGAAIGATADTVSTMVVTIGQLFTGKRSVKEMGGPLKIAQYSGQQATLGWFNVLMFMTLISINLGFINLLPIPMLDGGHLVFYAAEAIRGEPVGERVQELAFRTGLAALLTLMLFVTINDLTSFGLFRGLAG